MSNVVFASLARNWLKSQNVKVQQHTHKKLLLCDTDLSGGRRWALHYHYTLDSHSLIKPLKLCCLFLWDSAMYIMFLRAFILHSTQIIHTSHEKWSREIFTSLSNSFSSPSWQTLNIFTALTHLYLFSVETFSLLIYAFTQKNATTIVCLIIHLLFLSFPHSNRAIWKFIFYLFYFDTSSRTKKWEKILFQTIANFSSDIWW